MGDISEMMLDGILCEQCGTFVGESVGFPRMCSGCGGKSIVKAMDISLQRRDAERAGSEKVKCGKCKRMIAKSGIAQHNQAKHT